MLNYRGAERFIFTLSLWVSLLLIHGCTTSPVSHGDTIVDSPLNRFTAAARTAFYDKGTWPLLLAAAAFRSSDYDAEVADYAMDNKPLFSNNEKAARDTDTLRSLGYVFTYGTALAVEESWAEKGKRVVTDTGALYTTRLTTKQMNLQVDREYPGGGGDDAFGSHHAASPFAAAALTRRNVAELELPAWSARGINLSAYAIATASAWGRIEMGLHYPSDQLVSAAAGNFVAILFNETFLFRNVVIDITFSENNNRLALRIPF